MKKAMEARKQPRVHRERTKEEIEQIKEENREFLNDMISEDDMELQIDEPPMFSLKARNKAYELHRADPDYWSPLRLSNYFKKKI